MPRILRKRLKRTGKERIVWAMRCELSSEKQQTDAMPHAWEFLMPTDPQAVPSARHAAIQACQSAGASEEDCFALDLALGEALANAVTHGATGTYGSPKDLPVMLRLWQHHGRLIVEICDFGPGFDPPPPPYSMPDDIGATHGRGLPLMQRMTDALLVSRGDVRTGGASIYLVKELTGRP
jgi:anti-sigma regulatory factor (Ser/Thr protein kinase)